MSDLISRQAAIDDLETVKSFLVEEEQQILDCLISDMKKLPSAEPERKTGKWVPAFEGRYLGGAYWFNCSECGKIVPGGPQSCYNYCPRCGAYMREEE